MVLLICTFVLTERVRLLFVGYLPNLIVGPYVQFLSCVELGMVEICVKVVLDGRVSITIKCFKITQPPSSKKGKGEASLYIGVDIILVLFQLI